jgi:hypothetical protein
VNTSHVVVALLLLGAIALWGVVELRKLRARQLDRLRNLEVALAVATGPLSASESIVLRGSVEAYDLLTAPFSGRPCVAYRLRVFRGAGDRDVGVLVFEDGLLDVTRASDFVLATRHGSILVRPEASPAVLAANEAFRGEYEKQELDALRARLGALALAATIDAADRIQIAEDVIEPRSVVRARGSLRMKRDLDAPAHDAIREGVVGVLAPAMAARLVLASDDLHAIAGRVGAERDLVLAEVTRAINPASGASVSTKRR